ncbi:MAG: isocitrate/isopropylmalate family dehydrogenase [bacterium]|nr:isocitrate/isopropylmalate family dehydrogenase [bacterium]
MTTHTVTVMPGDGIGPEVMAATLLVLQATGVQFVWDHQNIGLSALANEGLLLPKSVIASVKRNKVGLKGPTGTPIGGGHRSINVTLRTKLDLYANVRPLRSMFGVPTLFNGVDLLIFRENTEDLYIGKERRLLRRGKRVAEAISRITEAGCERFARYAYAYARAHGRRKMTIGHKANILKKTHGLFLEVSRAVGSEFPDIATEDLIADNLGMQLVRELGRNPSRFDCLLLPNFLGDIFSDFCAGFTGGLGLAPGANIGRNYAIFEAVHGTAPDIAGRGIANPTALILSAAMMLDHLGERQAGERVRSAVETTLREGVSVTGDINPKNPVSTLEFANAVIAKL